MEIERKFLIAVLPENYTDFPHNEIEQGYLNTDPVIRIRKSDNEYYMTYKSKGFLSREEYNLPLTQDAYLHLKEKIDGFLISKTRYLIPFQQYTIELDIFYGQHQGLLLAEVEFDSEEEAHSFTPPNWFGEDVTYSKEYHNSYMSTHSLK